MKSPRSPFLEAPREIRDLIYEFYVATDDGLGYVYNFETGKIRPRSGLPIDLSLMYTCRTVATEMHGLALGQNTITFTTFYSEEWSSRVAEYDSFYHEVRELQIGSLACAETSVIATNARDEVTRDFPWFGAAYDAAMRIQPTQDIYHRDPFDIASCRARHLLVENGGPAPSLQFQAVLRALTLASATGQQFVDEVGNKPFRMKEEAFCPLALVRLGHLEPWAIPTQARLDELRKVWPTTYFADDPKQKRRIRRHHRHPLPGDIANLDEISAAADGAGRRLSVHAGPLISRARTDSVL